MSLLLPISISFSFRTDILEVLHSYNLVGHPILSVLAIKLWVLFTNL